LEPPRGGGRVQWGGSVMENRKMKRGIGGKKI